MRAELRSENGKKYKADSVIFSLWNPLEKCNFSINRLRKANDDKSRNNINALIVCACVRVWQQ